nr:MAG TPA: hypothetical protein [Caudoviricetes sp.]
MIYVKNQMDLCEKATLEAAKMDIITQASALEKQGARLTYIAMMADVDMDDLLAADDAGADSGMMDMPTDIERSEMDGKQEA